MRKPLTTTLARGVAFTAVLAAGCDFDHASAVEPNLGGGAQGVTDPHGDRPDALAVSPAHPAAIHILIHDALIRPWCGGVLVAPDVVVTAARCAAGVSASRLEIGTMIPGVHGEHAVAEVVALARDPRLVALVLAEPVAGVEPASIASLVDDECGVQSVSYLYVAEPDAPLSRWVWSGCYIAETHVVEPVRGEPNCHGDSGAPVFDEDGDLIGVVVAVSGHDVCIDELTLAGPDSGAYDEALELSR